MFAINHAATALVIKKVYPDVPIAVILQLIVLRWFYPIEALLVSAILAFVPYLLIRGPINRIARH